MSNVPRVMTQNLNWCHQSQKSPPVGFSFWSLDARRTEDGAARRATTMAFEMEERYDSTILLFIARGVFRALRYTRGRDACARATAPTPCHEPRI